MRRKRSEGKGLDINMEPELMTVRSKAYAPSVMKRIFVRVVNLSLIFITISAIVSLWVSGFNIQVLLTYSFLALMLRGYSRPHYEFYLADLLFGDRELMIQYHPQGKKQPPSLKIPYQTLRSAEYITQLSCFRLSFDRKVEGASNRTYHLLFMEKVTVNEFSSKLERMAGIKVLRMDLFSRREN